MLYTDGVCDVPPPHLLSEEDVREIVEKAGTESTDPESVATSIDRRLSEILAMEERNDDIALLVLRAQP